ncbi:MAG: xylose isomerase [Dehalococcoidia bacterium]|nr:xylose isomerase [Dehalococcoidia bacterium]
MEEKISLHSLCAWTFNAGNGGFLPANIRPSWEAHRFDTIAKIKLIRDKIIPRLPNNIQIGFEMHYDYEFAEDSADTIADALLEAGMCLALSTPGAHIHFGYGGIASLDPNERTAAQEYGQRTVALTCGPLRKAWHPDVEKAPTLVIWNGSFGYDIATPALKQMYENLKESIANLCSYGDSMDRRLYWAIEPKPNEGHPAMLLPTVASAIVFWKKLEKDFNLSLDRRGINKEFGHSEMIGLDLVNDTIEEIDNDMLVHMHVNSQGYNNGIILGGPGKFDVDHGVRICGINVALAALVSEAGYTRWKGHDMQPRPYDNEDQAVDRVVRSILSWEACATAAAELDRERLMMLLTQRETAKAEDLMREAVSNAQRQFDSMYGISYQI